MYVIQYHGNEQRYTRSTQILLRIRRLSRQSGGGGRRDPLRARPLRHHADRRRKIALLPAADPHASGLRHRGFAAHLADEGPGRFTAGKKHPGRLHQQHDPILRTGAGGRCGGTRRDQASLCRAGAVPHGFLPQLPLRHASLGHDRRRGALHQPVGARFPSLLLAARRSA